MRSHRVCARVVILCTSCGLMLTAHATDSVDLVDGYLFGDHTRLRDDLRRNLPDTPDSKWLEDPQLRVNPEIDDRDRFIQSYSVRFKPTNKAQRRARSNLFGVENELATKVWDKSLAAVLSHRYQELVNLAESELDLALQRRRLDFERQRLSSAQSLAATGNDNAKLQNLLLALEMRRLQLQRTEQQVLQLRSQSVASYFAVAADDWPRLTHKLVTPNEIESLLTLIDGDVSMQSLDTTIARLKIRQAEQALALEQSQSGFGLDLLELGYEDKSIDSYNLTFGFRLPIARSTFAEQKRSRELVAAKSDGYLVDQMLSREMEERSQRLRLKIDQYAESMAALQGFSGRIDRVGSADEVYVLRAHLLDLHANLANAHGRILHEFVDLLYLTGFLHQTPLRNWIKRL